MIHFGIFSRVPSTGSITYSELAADAGVPERTLKTVARMIMTSQVFYEPQPGSIAHTATSAQFVTNQSLSDWAQFMCEASVPAALSLVVATERWPTSQLRTETAYNVAANTDLPFFDHLATLPERTRQFAGYMKNVTSSEGTKLDHLLSGFNWAGLGSAKIVDVCFPYCPSDQSVNMRLTSAKGRRLHRKCRDGASNFVPGAEHHCPRPP